MVMARAADQLALLWSATEGFAALTRTPAGAQAARAQKTRSPR
jgi:transposase